MTEKSLLHKLIYINYKRKFCHLEWKESFSVENEELDRHHKKLFDLVNTILEAMKTEKSNDTVFITDILNSLAEYTQYHFQKEEAAFLHSGYPFAVAHIREHRLFTAKVKEMLANKNKNLPALNAIRIAQVANAWITDHVIRFDKGYAEYLDRERVLTLSTH